MPSLGNITGQRAQQLEDRIAHTERKVDGLVYALYGLTEEEVGVVEG